MNYKVAYIKNRNFFQYEIFSKSGALIFKVEQFRNMQDAEMQAKIKIRKLLSNNAASRLSDSKKGYGNGKI